MSLVDLFSALADPTRCRVVEMLHERSRPVHELAAAFDISRPAISRHLKVLKDAGLVAEEKAGRENVYSLQPSQLKPMLDWLEKHRAARPPKKAARRKPVVVEPVVAVPALVVKPVPVEPVAPVAEASRPRRAPRAPRAVVTAPPPAVAPQLSFFDL